MTERSLQRTKAWLENIPSQDEIDEAVRALFPARATPPEEVVVTRAMRDAGVSKAKDVRRTCPITWVSDDAMCELVYIAMHSARPKVSSEAPVDGAYAPCITPELAKAAYLSHQRHQHRSCIEQWLAVLEEILPYLSRHKPRPTSHDLPIKYQRNVNGIQTLSFNTRDGKERRAHENGYGYWHRNERHSREIVRNPKYLDRRSPKGAA